LDWDELTCSDDRLILEESHNQVVGMKKSLLLLVSVLLSIQIASGVYMQYMHIYPGDEIYQYGELYVVVEFSGTPCNSKVLFFLDDVMFSSKNLGCSTDDIESDVLNLSDMNVDCGLHEVRVELFQSDELIQNISQTITILDSPIPCNTNISGILSSNETWAKENSPYCVVGDTLIEEGNTLTIQPGVEVVFNNTKLYVDGTLNAMGNESDKILFREAASSAQLLFRGPYASVMDNFIMQGMNLDMEETSGQVNLTNGNLTNSFVVLRKSFVYNNEFDACYVEVQEFEGDGFISIINNSFHDGDDAIYLRIDDSRLNFIGNSIYDYDVGTSGFPFSIPDTVSVIYITSSNENFFEKNNIYNNIGESISSMGVSIPQISHIILSGITLELGFL